MPLEDATLPFGEAIRVGRSAAPPASRRPPAATLAGSMRHQWAGAAPEAGWLADGAFAAVRPGKRVDRSAAIVAAPGAFAFAAPLKAW